MIYPPANAFVYACKEYFAKLYIGDLRAYGRYVGVPNPTEFKKNPLIDLIVSILVGTNQPAPPSGRGAPVKNKHVDEDILRKVEELKALYLTPREEEGGLIFASDPEKRGPIFVESTNKTTPLQEAFSRPVYKGQLQTKKGVTYLLPIGSDRSFEKIVVYVEHIRRYDLREGDVVSCYAQMQKDVFLATQILSINEKMVGDGGIRRHFDALTVARPTKKLFSDAPVSVTEKYFSWILPLAKGQRGIIYSPPKAGKTRLLLELAKTATRQSELEVFALLIEQSLETNIEFSKVLPSDQIFFSSYSDEAEKHVSNAEMLLKRAKRHAEQGADVVIFVDSFSALMRAYNETEDSEGGKTLPCGVESKTFRYLKNFLGTGRAFEKKGSLTVIGTVSSQTGDPADDALTTELKSAANAIICLSRKLSMQRVFPAVDLFESEADGYEGILSNAELETEAFIRTEFLVKNSPLALFSALEKANDAGSALAFLKG